MKTIAMLFLLALPLACAGNQAPPVVPGSPLWVACADGGYCDARDSVCGVKGYACGEDDCCFTGDNGRAYGGKRKKSKVVSP